VEEVAHVVEAREVDVAVLLPLVLLPLDRVPLILQSPTPALNSIEAAGIETNEGGGRDRLMEKNTRGWKSRVLTRLL
jgi:hypothetical protein